MIYNYEFTELAINDIDETLNYITNNLCNKKAAVDSILDRIVHNIIFIESGSINMRELLDSKKYKHQI